METKTKNTTAKIIVASLAVLFVLLIVALIVNLVRLSAANERKDELTEQSAKLTEIIDKGEEALAYCQTSEFIENYARIYLDMIYRDEQVIGTN